jgi:hypothetical protein
MDFRAGILLHNNEWALARIQSLLRGTHTAEEK